MNTEKRKRTQAFRKACRRLANSGAPLSREGGEARSMGEDRRVAPLGRGGFEPPGAGDSCCTSATGPRICVGGIPQRVGHPVDTPQPTYWRGRSGVG